MNTRGEQMPVGVEGELNGFNLIARYFNAPDFTTAVEIDNLNLRIGSLAEQ
jgi:hypothetical protein